ncbi:MULTISPECIES: hypothetical protein [Giesbergeria]|uniref:Uncharacterized protein n=1 Tax=Giesbergeria sinuosa TaxID=80883 RepID=A0ABV9QB75_9BURK
MPDYKEQQATGRTWVRCRAMTVENPLNGAAVATFQETQCASINGVTSEQFAGMLGVEFRPDSTIALRNPETGELTGQTSTHAQVYQLLYSLYMQAALERDAAAPTSMAA